MSKLEDWFRSIIEGQSTPPASDADRDLLRRILEPMEPDWQRRFHVGTPVELKRDFWGIPKGTRGIVKELRPDDEKGRVLYVEFDTSSLHRCLDDMLPGHLPDWAKPYAHEPLRTTSTDVTPMDVDPI